VRASMAEFVVEKDQGVFEGRNGTRGPAGVAGQGRAQGEGDGASEVVAVDQGHESRPRRTGDPTLQAGQGVIPSYWPAKCTKASVSAAGRRRGGRR
jgi:hypothetical protein